MSLSPSCHDNAVDGKDERSDARQSKAVTALLEENKKKIAVRGADHGKKQVSARF